MSREIEYNKSARRKLQAGADKLANAVKVTLGAKGRNVIIEKEYGSPHVTKDGVTVAKNIGLPDPVENMGAEMVREAASVSERKASDGTTTTTVLAQSIIKESINILDGKRSLWNFVQANPMDLKRGIDKAVSSITDRLEDMSEKISNDNSRVKQIATISANSDSEIGNLIAEAMSKVGTDGVINVEESKTNSTYVGFVEGLSFVNTVGHPIFLNDNTKFRGKYEDILFSFIDDKVGTTKEILPIVELALKANKTLVIVANDFDGEVIATFAQNKAKKGFNIIPVKAPAYGEDRRETLKDLAIFTGGVVITQEGGIKPENYEYDMFGSAEQVLFDKETTTIVAGAGDNSDVLERVENLKSQINDETQEWDDKVLRRRISALTGVTAKIYVGASTEVEVKEKLDRIDDALGATKSAIEEGIVAGGGIALIEAAKTLESLVLPNRDQRIGAEILKRAVEAPLSQIAENSGLNPKKVIKTVKEKGYPYGYDSKEDAFVDMLQAGIIDPKKVTRVALESAASVATLIFTSEATVSLIRKSN